MPASSLSSAGSAGGFASAPEIELNQADIVFGRARVIVEGLSCGRAAYVYDGDAGDGSVTPETYPRLVADNSRENGRRHRSGAPA